MWSFFSKKMGGEGQKSVPKNQEPITSYTTSVGTLNGPVVSTWAKDNEQILRVGAKRFSKDFGSVMHQLANE